MHRAAHSAWAWARVLWRTDKSGDWRLTDDPWDDGAVLRA
jgi:hypothetical protein